MHINEFIVWEIIEPLIQNSIDHSIQDKIIIKIETIFNPNENKSLVIISDNGKGINPELIKLDKNGTKRIFSENVSTKSNDGRKSGYGCYIAHQMATKRCGWRLDVENLSEGGCRFIIEI